MATDGYTPDSGTDSDSDSGSESDYSYEDEADFMGESDKLTKDRNTRQANITRFKEALDEVQNEMLKEIEEDTRSLSSWEELWDFPKDEEGWRETDLKEYWVDAPLSMTKPGWDPKEADSEDWEAVEEEIDEGNDPKVEPFYVPYRKAYPVVPDNHADLKNPKDVVEELDRIEEFLTWVSFVFKDGSSYEGTVWDDLAHGKGVYVAEKGLVKYEGEWLNNDMEGHGVVEVDVPDIEPIPGSKLEAKMRAQGKIIGRDFMSPEDRKWLEMDVEDSLRLANGKYEVPYYERDLWLNYYGNKPEKGRYRYAGQWKHGRMHGCGVYELNEHQIYGRFYFGEFEELATDCTEEISAMHAGIAEVAAAKARMFAYKPDGMVREERGPFSDPQHHYFYEDEDVWMAPGFINQFHEVPDYWKKYVQDVDQEREMWLNSFYKSPLRIPMPSELEHWWSEDQEAEFVVLSKEPEPDPEDPSKLLDAEDPVILHRPTGRIINLVDDEEHGFRMCWQHEEGEDADNPAEPQFLPLGFDEFFGIEREVEETKVQRLLRSVENVVKPIINGLEKWSEEKKKDGDFKRKLMESELELVDAQLCLEEAIDSIDEDVDAIESEEIEEERKMGIDETEKVEVASEEKVEDKLPFEKEDTSSLTKQDKEPVIEETEEVEDEDEDEDGDEEEEDDDAPPSSFGSVTQADDPKQNSKKGNEPGQSPFATASLLFGSCGLLSAVPSKLRQSFSASRDMKMHKPRNPFTCSKEPCGLSGTANQVRFPPVLGEMGSLRAKKPTGEKLEPRNLQSIRTASQLRSLSRILSRNLPRRLNPKEHPEMHGRKESGSWLHAAPETDSDSILSMHTQIPFPGIAQFALNIGVELD